jgi:hypothetical protein
MGKIIFSVALVLFLLAFTVFLARAFSEKQLDDVNPYIQCDEKLLEKADVFYVIPIFENKSIAENKTWCDEIKSMNKTLALHGIYHTFNEFNEERNDDYLLKGIEEFEKCFGFFPERFKPPQMAISGHSIKTVEKKMQLDLYLNSILHKAYHCNDSGIISNRMMDIF